MTDSAPEHQHARLAVLIDADNTSASSAAALLEELARYGIPTVKRAYGDWTTQQLVGWKAELPRHAIQPIQQFANTVGKNSTDSALIIDAMDLLYSGNLDAFAIVSSDSDFTRLATRLRESGKTVYGLGRRRTPTSLQTRATGSSSSRCSAAGRGRGTRGRDGRRRPAASRPAPDPHLGRRDPSPRTTAGSCCPPWAATSRRPTRRSTRATTATPSSAPWPGPRTYLEVDQSEGGTSLRVRLKPSTPAKAAAKTASRRSAKKTQKAQKAPAKKA